MNRYMYIVEGETEAKFINALKEGEDIFSGSIKVLNALSKNVASIIRYIKPNTSIILVFDVDVLIDKRVLLSTHFEKNIKLLKRTKNVKEIFVIQQVKTLEDEIVRATDIKEIKELLNSKSNKNVKSDINKCTNLYVKLKEKNFKIAKLWEKVGVSSLPQDSDKIKGKR